MIHSPLLKSAIMKTVPRPILHDLLIVYTKIKTRKLRKIFEQAPEKPAWLGLDTLESLQEQYPFPRNTAAILGLMRKEEMSGQRIFCG